MKSEGEIVLKSEEQEVDEVWCLERNEWHGRSKSKTSTVVDLGVEQKKLFDGMTYVPKL